MALSEIEKLERRYAENPQGLTFAPLAEIHRKNGDVARALDLLRLGLELHPDYIPASIVLGRCHLDLGDLPAAETAFTHVLGLDGENVIALKSLADISERQHHFDEAERWLRTLLSVDRSNDEARAQLERIETARRDAAFAPPPPTPMEEEVEAPAASAPAAAAESEVAPEPPTHEALPTVTPRPAPEPIVPVEPWVSPAADEAVPMPLEDLEPALLSDVSEPPPPGLQTEEPETVAEPVEPLLGLIGRDVDQPEPEEFRVELSEDIVLRSAGGHEFQVPDAAAELSDRMPMSAPSSPFGEERAPGFGGLEEPPAPPAPGEPQPAAASAGEPEADRADAARWPFMGQRVAEPDAFAPAAEQQEKVPVQKVEAAPEPQAEASREPPAPIVVSEPEPDLVVTETMAEVLLHQGHSAEALRVYRELEVRNVGDPRLLRKIAEIEEESRTPPSEPAAPAAARRQYTASQTGGQSLRAFFQELLAARPASAAAAPPLARPTPVSPPPDSSGAPTRPAADALSLSSVFGEETTPLPPAVPAGGPAPAGGVSFDEFYSPPGAAAASKPRAPDPKNDDLDQFHTWLQNLKR